jgi:hypothetical protein
MSCSCMVSMNRAALQAAAEREGISSTSYCLTGGLPPEQHVLAIVEGGWSVYYSEHGVRTDETFFNTEDEACSELLIRLVGDPTTRIDI